MLPHLASLLAIVPMLLHSIIGCCWHHAHTGGGEHVHVAAFAGHSHGHEDRRHEEHGHEEHGQQDCGHEHQVGEAPEESLPGESPACPSPCEESRCTFCGTTRLVTAMSSAELLTPLLTGPAKEMMATVAVSQQPQWECCEGTQCSAAALKLRALIQVWQV
ncbi:MAG: hypothetical protein R3B90_10875 [Planctomycetaceae bacterium]